MKRKVSIIIAGILVLAFSKPAVSAVKIEKMNYEIYRQCYAMSNDTVQVIVTADIGPRVISYKLLSGKNIFAEMDSKVSMKTDYGEWHPWGGHRLLHAPEAVPRSYVPDDSPVTVKQISKNALKLTPPVEKQTGIQKEMLVRLDDSGPGVEITHYLTNKSIWPVELAPWALSVMREGGEAIIPNEPSASASVLPVRKMALWNYTDLSDPRWIFGTRYTRIRCDKKYQTSQKGGFENKRGWTGYLQAGDLFIKRFEYDRTKTYPDEGCNNEVYTAGSLIEIESLGHMWKLDPGQTATHIERWYLFNIALPATEEALDLTIQRHLKETRAVGKN